MPSKHICFLLERGDPPRRNLVIEDTIALLEARGAVVQTLYPEEALLRVDALRPEADLYALKSNTDLALCLATVLERVSARVINTAAATTRAKNKVVAAATLFASGLPTPRSLAAARPGQLQAELARSGALVLKPHRGHYGIGVTVAEGPASLPAAEAFCDPDLVFAQTYLRGACTDLKVFGVGAEVWGVRKRFVAGQSFAAAGEAVTLAPAVEALARQTARAFGLELYGLDVAEGPDGAAWVVDVNAFPGYRGVPDAARRLADLLLAEAA
jgi:ribosomal protein S6--L-glutamate ligase